MNSNIQELNKENIENCETENSEDLAPQRRSRSSFFERRESDVCEPSVHVDADDIEDEEHEEYLNKYYVELRTEKDQWKKEVQNRRTILHDAESELKLAKKSNRIPINYSVLSDEDIEFLQRKPNLKDLRDSVTELQKSTGETCALYKRLMELEDVILDHVEEKVDQVTELLLEDSDVE